MDKVVLITGSGSGIGKGIALKYAEFAFGLSLTDINETALQETAKQCLKSNCHNILQTVADISNDDDVKTLVKKTIENFGRLDILINCAGILRFTNLMQSNLMDVYDSVMAVNLRSIVFLTSLCTPNLIERSGCIINIASILAYVVKPNCLAYNVSKAGLDHFTRCAALELAPRGVRVNAILPGVVSSSLFLGAGMERTDNENYMKRVATATPLKRRNPIEVNEIADLVMYLTSKNAQSITGASYVIDAGESLTGINEFELSKL